MEGGAERNKPVKMIQAGRIMGLVFKNRDEKKGDWYSVSINRIYEDAAGKKHSAKSFGRDDLLVVSEVSRKCWDWIVSQNGEGD